MSRHSELKEWLGIIPPLPWRWNGQGICASNGVEVLGESGSSDMKLSERGAVQEYAVHACNQLPKLLDAAYNFKEAMAKLCTERAINIPMPITRAWNALHDAVSTAGGEQFTPEGAPTAAADLADAQAEIKRMMTAFTLLGTRCANWLNETEKAQGFDTGEAVEFIRSLMDAAYKGAGIRDVQHSIDDDIKVECGNCAWTGTALQMRCQLEDVPNLTVRICPGEEVPAGECPECGALCHMLKDKPDVGVATFGPVKGGAQ